MAQRTRHSSFSCRAPIVASAPAVSGLLLSLALPPADFGALAWIALAPLALCWQRPKLPRATYWSAALGGCVFSLTFAGWLRTCYLQSSGWFGPYTAGWLAIGLIGSGFFLAMFVFGHAATQRLRWPMWLVLPVVWVSYELARHYGAAAFDQTGFPWGKLAVSQVDLLPVLQIADLGGAFLVSGFVAMANGLLVDLLTSIGRLHGHASTARTPLSLMSGCALLAAALGYGHLQLSQPVGVAGPTVCLMGGEDLPPLLDHGRILPMPTDDATMPDILIWPELAWHHKVIDVAPGTVDWATALPDHVRAVMASPVAEYPTEVRRQLIETAIRLGTNLVIGCEHLRVNEHGHQQFNSLLCATPGRRSVACYDKRFLVPWGEFTPYGFSAAAARPAWFYDHGNHACPISVDTHVGRLTFAPAICYDILFPSQFAGVARRGQACRGVDFLVHCGAEGQDATGLLSELLQREARLRAIESRRAMVRSINFGYSGIIDGSGRVLQKLPRTPVKKPVTLGAVPIDTRCSVYTHTGDWPVVAVCALFACTAFFRRRPARE